MRLFLDTSVLLAACRSLTGASREIFRLAKLNEWSLIGSSYVMEEVAENLADMGTDAQAAWPGLAVMIEIEQDVLTLDRPVVYTISKDKPILFSALAWSEVLLTLDENDFGDLIGSKFYELEVFSPGGFIARQRRSGKLIE